MVATRTRPRAFTSDRKSRAYRTVTGYRYDFGDGSPMLETGSPTVTHQVASGGRTGPVVVAATDSLGHVGLQEAG